MKHRDLEETVFRRKKTYDEIVDILDVKNKARSTQRYTLPVGIDEVSDIKSMLMSVLPNKIKVNIKIDDFRLKSISTTNKTNRITEKSFLHYIEVY